MGAYKMLKPQNLIRKKMPKSFDTKLNDTADILAVMSKYIERRQVIDSDYVSKKDIRILNEVLKITLDYDDVTSPSFIIALKKNAIKAALGVSMLSTLIKDRRNAAADETEILFNGFAYLPDFGISTNKLFGYPKSNYSFLNSPDDQDDLIFYKGFKYGHLKSFGMNGKTWDGHYYLPYQYTVTSASDMTRFAKALEKYELEQKKARSLAAKKAAVTRKENKKIAEQKEIDRLAREAKKAKELAEHQAKLIAWDVDYCASCADVVAKIKHDITEYMAVNADCSKALYIDTETTDLGDDRKVIDIAIVDSDENIIVNTLINDYEIAISTAATRVHGIVSDDLEGKPRLIYFEQEIMDLLKNRDVYFYNDDFDMLAIRNSASDNFSFECAKNIDDVMYRFAAVYGEMPDWAHSYTWQTLATACNYYGIELGTHRALSDAIATCRVHKAMIETKKVDKN